MEFYNDGVPTVINTGSGSNGNGGFFGGSDGWLGLIVILALFGGFGRFGNGFGGNGGGYSGVGENYVLATDFATIERKLDGINNGICDSTFALNNTVTNGFFGVQNALTQGFAGLNTAVLQGNNALASQLASCCCGIEKILLENRYIDAQNTCAITTAISNSTRDIIESQNANYRALHDEIVANRIEDKNAQISELKTALNNANLMASQAQQSAFLVEKLSPKCPVPAFLTCNPYTGQTYSNGYGYSNSGCGCGNSCC